MIRLEQSQRRFDRVAERARSALDSEIGRIQVELDNARRLCRQYESALEEVREKNIVLETTIQTLTASHKLLIERYDAECSVEARRKNTTMSE
jgi:F0F1-type ATP synthase membrane subunit b/b'